VLLKVLAFIFIARALWKLCFGILDGYAAAPKRRDSMSVGLVRDPVCGTFVTPSHALVAGAGANARYFCSEKCRRQWNG
jgi:YHS domain-containing protein